VAAETQSHRSEEATRRREWLALNVPEEDRRQLEEQAAELEATTVPYPLIAGLAVLVGAGVPLGLLFASL
jgi:hypothetical protein